MFDARLRHTLQAHMQRAENVQVRIGNTGVLIMKTVLFVSMITI
jgi:hypothetical protein